jgi:hypothetical protein
MKIAKSYQTSIFVMVVIIIILIAGLGLIFTSDLGNSYGKTIIGIAESNAVSGVPFELHVTSTGDRSSMIFPDNILVADDGIFRNVTVYNFTGRTATIEILIPITVSEIDINISSGNTIESFKISVQAPSETLVSGESYYNHVETMARRFNNRNVGSPQMKRAADHYKSFFGQLGYESEIREYQRRDGLRTYDVLDVVAYKWGIEHPNEWIIIGGHYDIVQKSIEGAFDNTGGACTVVELAEGFAKLKTSRTIVFGLWDGEEKGLWGSNFFANDLPADVDVKAYLNFDMVGLNWPLPYDLLILMGPGENDDIDECPELNNISKAAVFQYLGYPGDGIDIHESSGGGSDHLSFQRVGVQTYFFYGNAPYIQYHRRTDLLVDMVLYAGGQDQLKKGFETVAWIAFYITLLLDNNNTLHQGPPPE